MSQEKFLHNSTHNRSFSSTEQGYDFRRGLDKTNILPPPKDIKPEEIAYNPSAIQHVNIYDKEIPIVYLRVEPNRSDELSSHLGKTVSRPYYLEPSGNLIPVETLSKTDSSDPGLDEYDIPGEDPAFQKIRATQDDGSVQERWMLSVVSVTPSTDRPDVVDKLQTVFYLGDELNNLREVARGPIGMKDIRLCSAHPYDPTSTELFAYGRPQGPGNLGNITFVKLDSWEDLRLPDVQRQLCESIIDPNLYDQGSWGGVNDAIMISESHCLLLTHQAWRVGDNSRRYEPVLLIHNTDSNKLFKIGTVAPPEAFLDDPLAPEPKEDANTDLSGVVFTGGLIDRQIVYQPRFGGDSAADVIIPLTVGYRDSSVALAISKLSEAQRTLWYEALQS